MAEFLSAAWITELDAAARSADGLTIPDGVLILEQVVRGSAHGDVRYQVHVSGNGTRVVTGSDSPADVVLLTDPATARALHVGRLRAQDALAAGLLKVQGRPEALAKRSDLLARLDAAFAPVRARTTFPDGR